MKFTDTFIIDAVIFEFNLYICLLTYRRRIMIVYGHNNFLLKSYTPQELGISKDGETSGILLQVRQRYAHLFWIPFFPIGKLWVIKKAGDESLYQMPLDIKNAIIARHGTPGTPWYSFALILIGLAIGLFIKLGDVMDNQRYESNFYNRVEESKMLIKYPTTGDCYVFRKYESQDKWSDSDDIILKVKAYDETKTQFISLYEDLYNDAESNDQYDYHNSFDLAEAYNYNPTYIDKKALENTLENEYNGSKTPVKLSPLEGYYILEKVDRRPLEE